MKGNAPVGPMARIPWAIPAAAFAWVSSVCAWAWLHPLSFHRALSWAALDSAQPGLRALALHWAVFPATEALAAFASLALAFLALGKPFRTRERVLALSAVPACAWVVLAGMPSDATALAGPSALGASAIALRCVDAFLRRREALTRWLFAGAVLVLAHAFSDRGAWSLLAAGAGVGLLGASLSEAGERLRRGARLWILEREIRRETRVRDKVDRLLLRIGREGMDRLSPAERRFLYRASRFYRLSRRELPASGRGEKPFLPAAGDPLRRPR